MNDIYSATVIVNNYIPQDQKDHTQDLLRAMIDFSPTSRGRLNICQDIVRCQMEANGTQGDNLATRLRNLSQYYSSNLLVPMRAKGGQTPKTTEHPSRQETMDQETMLNELLMSGRVATRERSTMKNLALRRDNYRSVLSGLVDDISIQAGLVPDTEFASFTQAAHIIPFSFGSNPEQAVVWTVLEHFSGMNVAMDLCEQNINRLSNILTLTMHEHQIFGRLSGWLEAVPDQGHTYRMCSQRRYLEFPQGKVVTFTTTRSEYDLPDPRFIAIHAACAKVLHASGMAEFIDRIIRDLEELKVLAEDGSSDVLFHALSGIAIESC
ncbi:hypothetical protein OPQ81_000001 [Rhizoctonia solani]|nr:hypothetical protein OPQ81_000001 [Rhizoctonia solani]